MKSLVLHRSPWAYLKLSKWRLFLLLAVSFLSSVFLVSGYLISSVSFDYIAKFALNPKAEFEFGFYFTTGLTLAFLAIFAFFYVLNSYLKESFSLFIAQSMRDDLASYMAKRGIKKYRQIGNEKVFNWYGNDIDNISSAYVNISAEIMSNLSAVIFTFIFFIYPPSRFFSTATSQSNYVIAIIFMIVLVINFFIPLVLRKIIQKRAMILSLSEDIVTKRVLKMIDHFTLLLVNRSFSHAHKQIEAATKKWAQNYAASKNSQVYAQNLSSFVSEFFNVIIILTIIFSALSGLIDSIGFLFIGTFLITNISNQVKSLLDYYLLWKESQAATKKWKNELNFEEKALQEETLEEFESFECRNLVSEYIASTKTKAINLTIKKGQKIALVGLNGSGKSVLIATLLGLNTNYQGQIYWNQKLLKKEKEYHFFKAINLTSNKNIVVNETLANNIALSFEPDSKILAKAKEEALIDFQLEASEPNINKLSSGQKQRIDLARNFYFSKKFVIFDEALSNLDQERAQQIENQLILKKDITFLHVLHTLNEKDYQKYDYVLYL